MPTTFDAVSLEIAWKRLISITDQMAATLKRTSFSPLVREGNDFSCLLLGADASSAVQSSVSGPSFLGTLPYTVQQMLDGHLKWWRWLGDESESGGKIDRYESGNLFSDTSGAPQITADTTWAPSYPYTDNWLPANSVALVVDACSGILAP